MLSLALRPAQEQPQRLGAEQRQARGMLRPQVSLPAEAPLVRPATAWLPDSLVPPRSPAGFLAQTTKARDSIRCHTMMGWTTPKQVPTQLPLSQVGKGARPFRQ